ncbi:MAG: hypothetical protein ACRDNZ_03910 [Streptosporangiaceae bacterium]
MLDLQVTARFVKGRAQGVRDGIRDHPTKLDRHGVAEVAEPSPVHGESGTAATSEDSMLVPTSATVPPALRAPVLAMVTARPHRGDSRSSA